jgi:hypothetical protein
MAISNLYTNAALDALITAAGAMTIGLSTTQPVLNNTVPAGASNITEPVDGGYARATITASTFAAAANRMKSSSTDITFPAPTADWGNVGWVIVWDSANKVVFFGDLADQVNILGGGSAPVIPAGTLSIYLPE